MTFTFTIPDEDFFKLSGDQLSEYVNTISAKHGYVTVKDNDTNSFKDVVIGPATTYRLTMTKE